MWSADVSPLSAGMTSKVESVGSLKNGDCEMSSHHCATGFDRVVRSSRHTQTTRA